MLRNNYLYITSNRYNNKCCYYFISDDKHVYIIINNRINGLLTFISAMINRNFNTLNELLTTLAEEPIVILNIEITKTIIEILRNISVNLDLDDKLINQYNNLLYYIDNAAC